MKHRSFCAKALLYRLLQARVRAARPARPAHLAGHVCDITPYTISLLEALLSLPPYWKEGNHSIRIYELASLLVFALALALVFGLA